MIISERALSLCGSLAVGANLIVHLCRTEARGQPRPRWEPHRHPLLSLVSFTAARSAPSSVKGSVRPLLKGDTVCFRRSARRHGHSGGGWRASWDASHAEGQEACPGAHHERDGPRQQQQCQVRAPQPGHRRQQLEQFPQWHAELRLSGDTSVPARQDI